MRAFVIQADSIADIVSSGCRQVELVVVEKTDGKGR